MIHFLISIVELVDTLGLLTSFHIRFDQRAARSLRLRSPTPLCISNRVKQRPPLRTGCHPELARPDYPTPNGPSKANRPERHRFVPIDPKVAFEGLRRDGADRTYRQFALAGGAPTNRTANAVRVRLAGQSERPDPL